MSPMLSLLLIAYGLGVGSAGVGLYVWFHYAEHPSDGVREAAKREAKRRKQQQAEQQDAVRTL